MVDGARAPIPITEERRRAIGLVRSGRVERRGVLRTFGRGFGFRRRVQSAALRRRGSRRPEINSEAEFALEYWNCSLPEKIENVVEDDSKDMFGRFSTTVAASADSDKEVS